MRLMANVLLVGGVICAVGMVSTVMAQEKPVVLTPTKLYDLIESQQKVTANHGKRLVAAEKELALFNRFWGDEDTQGSLNKAFKAQDYRIKDLERKVTGMQGAINRLFARVEKLEKGKPLSYGTYCPGSPGTGMTTYDAAKRGGIVNYMNSTLVEPKTIPVRQ